MKKIFYTNIENNETRLIVDFLKQKAQWEPVMFNGSPDMIEWVQENYSKAILVDDMKIRQGFFDYSKIGKCRPIDSEIIKNLSSYQSNYISWMQDTTGWNFSYFERYRYYYQTLTYWNTAIYNLKPDMFIAYTWPHTQSDYALYLLCKYHYKIPVIFMDITPFFNKYYYTTGCALEDLSLPFKDNYNSNKIFKIDKVVQNYLDKLRSENPVTPVHINKYHDKLKRSSNILKDFLKLIFIIVKGRGFKKARNSFKSNKKPWGQKDALLSNIGVYFFLQKMFFKGKLLKRNYSKLVSKISKSDKYIYFAAPYQPEAISNISCGVYEDPFLILDMISNAIPEDWYIYYKEHPTTFKEIYKGTLYKDKNFYTKLSKYKNIKFISVKEDSFKLIDGSMAVATVGGTVGWEAIVRGKPTLLFGNLWYQECKSVFSIKTYEDLERSIKKIINGYKPIQSDVDRYAQSIYLSCKKDIIVLNNFNDIEKSKNDMKKIADFLLASQKKFYPDL